MTGHDQQLAFDFPHRPALGRDDFLVAPNNEKAMELIERWPDWPGPIVVVVGPPGSGKSHLGEVWRLRTNARRARAGELELAALPALLETGALLLEDLPDKATDDQILFHLINLARNEGGHILATSRSYPAQWPVSLPDLKTRLRAAVVTTLGAPDDTLLRAVLVKLFVDRQIAIDVKMLNYLLMRMERSLGAANRLVDTIDRLALARQSAVTFKIAATALAEVGADTQSE